MKRWAILFLCAFGASCQQKPPSLEGDINPIMIDYLGYERVEVISKATSVVPIMVSDSSGNDDQRPKAGPFVITETLSKLSDDLSKKAKLMALDINIYGNQRRYLYASKEIAEKQMTYDLCIFEPQYAVKFEYKNEVDYFFISSSCEKIAHSYHEDFIHENTYDGSIKEMRDFIQQLFKGH